MDAKVAQEMLHDFEWQLSQIDEQEEDLQRQILDLQARRREIKSAEGIYAQCYEVIAAHRATCDADPCTICVEG